MAKVELSQLHPGLKKMPSKRKKQGDRRGGTTSDVLRSMTDKRDSMRFLVVSPIPSFPQDQGNSSRIHHFCQRLMALGHSVTFIYAGMERDDLEILRAMAGVYEEFLFVSVPRRKQFSHADCFGIDDWYQRETDPVLDRLFASRRFDAIIVNYVWFSHALINAPSHCTKIIDTHDIFADRGRRLQDIGVRPQWFFTSVGEEKKGLDRADYVIAIQDEEAAHLQSNTSAKVFTIGHLVEERFLEPRGSVRQVGMMASSNPLNVKAVNELARALRRRSSLDHLKFVLAGRICDVERLEADEFIKVGFCENPLDFYDKIDVCLNPHIGGTGLKIKSVEALSFGMPLLATADAMIGIPAEDPTHLCKSPEELLDRLEGVSSTQHLAALSRNLFTNYQRNNENELTHLLTETKNLSR